MYDALDPCPRCGSRSFKQDLHINDLPLRFTFTCIGCGDSVFVSYKPIAVPAPKPPPQQHYPYHPGF